MEEKHIGIPLARSDDKACRFSFSLADYVLILFR